MKVLLYMPETDIADLREAFRIARSVLNRAGVTVITADQPPAPDGQSTLDSVDAYIIEGSVPDSEVGYLLAFAIAKKKPTMLLLMKGRLRHNPLETFGQKHRVPPTISQVSYALPRLEPLLLAFLAKYTTLTVVETPSIKFTLRLTEEMEQYLHWKTHNTDRTKAEYLRDLLQRILDDDAEYQQFKRRRHNRPSP